MHTDAPADRGLQSLARADVAQLARASPCHGEGRGFESHHPLIEGLGNGAFFDGYEPAVAFSVRWTRIETNPSMSWPGTLWSVAGPFSSAAGLHVEVGAVDL